MNRYFYALFALAFTATASCSGTVNAASSNAWSSVSSQRDACYIERSYTDGFTLVLGHNTAGYFLAIGGKKRWKAIEVGESYPLIVHFRDDVLTFESIGTSSESVLVQSLSPATVHRLEHEADVSFTFQSSLVGPYDLTGSLKAISDLNSCFRQLDHPASEPEIASENTPPANAAVNQSIDIRECPLDTYTFTDDLFGTTFDVLRVGRQGRYKCGDAFYDTEISSNCQFLGDTVLAGTLTTKNMLTALGQSQPVAKDVTLTWTRIEGASPCCFWSIDNTGAIPQPDSRKGTLIDSPPFSWLGRRNMITLQNSGFNRIDPDFAIGSREFREFVPLLHPTSCTMEPHDSTKIVITAEEMYLTSSPSVKVSIGEVLTIKDLGRRFGGCRVAAEYYAGDEEWIETRIECDGASVSINFDDSGHVNGFWTSAPAATFMNNVQVGEPVASALGNEAFCNVCTEDEPVFCKPTEQSQFRYDVQFNDQCALVPSSLKGGCWGTYSIPECVRISGLGIR